METSVALLLAPRVFVPVVVSVRPAPIRTIAEEPAVFVPEASPPIVWSKASTSSVAVGVAAVAVEALPSWTMAFGEKVFVAEPLTVPATTRMGPALTLLVFVKVSVPRPPLVMASLLAALSALLSARVRPKVTSPVVVTSVAEVPATRSVEVEAAELVTNPATVRDCVCGLKSNPLRSRPAPAPTTIALVVGMAAAMPYLRIPPVMLTAAPLKLFAAEESTSTPAPALVRAVPVAVVVIAPPRVAVTNGLVTVIVRPAAPRSVAPVKVRLWPATRPPKVKSPPIVSALATERAVPSARSVVPPETVSVPVPSGPLVTIGAVPVLAAPIISDPAVRLMPLVKVLSALVRASVPTPALMSGPVMPALSAISAETMRPVAAKPELTVMVGLALLNCSTLSVDAAAPVSSGVVE